MVLTARHQLPELLIVCGAFLISFSAVWVKIANVPPMVSAFYRVFFGFLFLITAAAWRGDLKKPSHHVIKWVALCGLLFGLDLIFWHASIGYIGPGLATIIGNFQVFLLAAIGYWVYGEQLRLRFLIALPLAVGGLFLVIEIPHLLIWTNTTTGVIFGLLTAICYSGFLLSLKKIQSEDQQQSFFYSLMAVSLASSFFLGTAITTTSTSFAIPSIVSLLALLGLGLFSQTVGWTLIAFAMPKIRTSLTGFILLLQPALAFIWDVVLFDRSTTFTNWIGVILLLSAMYMGMTGKEKRIKQPPSDTE